jgi:uncharacterized membrane protein
MRLVYSISGTAMVLVVTIMLSVITAVSASTLLKTRSRQNVVQLVNLATVVLLLFGVLRTINVMNDISYVKHSQCGLNLDALMPAGPWSNALALDSTSRQSAENGKMIESV